MEPSRASGDGGGSSRMRTVTVLEVREIPDWEDARVSLQGVLVRAADVNSIEKFDGACRSLTVAISSLDSYGREIRATGLVLDHAYDFIMSL